jgi:hypothetical protein
MQTINTELADIETYFIPQYLSYPGSFQWEGIEFELVKTLHIESNHEVLHSYGLFFVANNTKIFFTTDTKLLLDEFMPYYEQSDIIFHDCETQIPPSTVHSTYFELESLSKSIKKKMWLYHYNTGNLPDALSDGFLGFVQKGQIFQF